jgi:hypothetical protein
MSARDTDEPHAAPPTRGQFVAFLIRFPWRTLFITVIALCVLAVVLVLMRRGPAVRIPPESTSRVEVHPSPNVIVAIHDLARLETVTYHMERVVEINDEQTHVFGLVNARDALLLIAVGDVIAGVDLQQIRDGDIQVDWAHHSVRVSLPPTQVFSATLDNAQTHVYSRSTDSMASRREDLEERARRDAESTMRRAAVDAGILRRAQTSAEAAIRSLLHSMGFEQIDIVSQTIRE